MNHVMEENKSSEHTAIPSGVEQQPSTQPLGLKKTHKPASHLSKSEPRPARDSQQLLENTNFSSSVPSLRFPRPLGNRQLINWVSSSSPDIMQPGNPLDEDQSLADLGYDVIGADGESQAASMVSSIDYQRPDDVQSLGGTDTGTDVDANDVDTDSSDDEEEVILDDTGRAYTYAEVAGHAADEDDAEAFSVQSLENPTSLMHHSDSFPELAARSRTSTLQAQHSDDAKDKSDTKSPQGSKKQGAIPYSEWTNQRNKLSPPGFYQTYGGLITQKLPLLLLGLALTWASFLLVNPPQNAPKTLSTVPVACVSTEGASVPIITATTISTTAKTQVALETSVASSRSNSLMSVSLDSPAAPQASRRPAEPVCSAEVYSRNEILVKIPLAIKASWLSKDAIKLAVSRDGVDIPTNVTTITAGFVIEVPAKQAYGVFEVSILTERKPKIHEIFRVEFGQHTITDVLDVSKQLVKDIALYVAQAVNETTAWVHEVSAPAVGEGVSLSQNVLERMTSVRDQFVRDTASFLESPIAKEELARRGHQLQVELKRAALDLRDDLSLTLLTAQLHSKLWWLKAQGRMEEYKQYLDNAEAYYKAKNAETEQSKTVRGNEAKSELGQRAHSEKEQRRFEKFWQWGKMLA